MRARENQAGESGAVADIHAESAQDAADAGLVYVSDAEPGIRRLRRGKKFAYAGPEDRPIRSRLVLVRIAKLAVPPAYSDVWICANARGHIQATGRDARGRKQYRYHAEWRTARDGNKFERMKDFGAALPRLRRRLRRDLALPGLPRDKVLAVVGTLLDTTRVRIGNPEYARDNNSFGLTTLRNRHVRFVRDHRAVLSFRGKGGAEHEVEVDDRRIVRIVRHCQDLPGQQLFQYIDDDGQRRAIDSDMVNAYLRAAMGGEFTAKDFRTWGATMHAISLMADTPLPERQSERAMKSCITSAIKEVAAGLRNTPAVCRKSYINPLVFTAWRCGALHELTRTGVRRGGPSAERMAMSFLETHPNKPEVRAGLHAPSAPIGFGGRNPTRSPVAGRHPNAAQALRLNT